MCIGVLQLAVGFGVFVKNQFSRWTGVVAQSAGWGGVGVAGVPPGVKHSVG